MEVEDEDRNLALNGLSIMCTHGGDLSTKASCVSRPRHQGSKVRFE
jgi:hypothetical protein